jgi:SAM-dependent methyltransferase
MAEAAALARIEEMAKHGRMSMAGDRMTETAGDADTQIKAAARAAWALGDYHRFAKATVWEVGPVLVEACGISPGQRVLDVAAGTGNTAIRAALAGAEVVASDLVPENFEAGRREAKAQGSSWSGSKTTPRLSPLAPASSTSSRLRSGRSSPLTIKQSPTRCCACAGPGARSECSTSPPRA